MLDKHVYTINCRGIYNPDFKIRKEVFHNDNFFSTKSSHMLLNYNFGKVLVKEVSHYDNANVKAW